MALKVLTWNVENFFRPGGESEPKTPEEYAAKRQALADVIEELDADVVALQDLGGDEELADLQQSLGGSYPNRATGTPDQRGIRVGFCPCTRWRTSTACPSCRSRRSMARAA